MKRKYMSIGSYCYVAQLLKMTDRRISGPFDWMAHNMDDYCRALMYHLSETTFNNILLRKFSPTIEIEKLHNGVTFDFCKSLWLPHENLFDLDQYKKVIRRFLRFHDLINNGGNLLFMGIKLFNDYYDDYGYSTNINKCIDQYRLNIGKFVIINIDESLPESIYDHNNCTFIVTNKNFHEVPFIDNDPLAFEFDKLLEKIE